MSFRDVLGNREFAALWGAGALSNIGSSIHSITVIWVAYTLTNDPRLVALVALATLVPDLVFSIPAGTFVDRFNRKWILILADLVRAVAVATLPALLFTGRDGVLIPVLVGVSVVEGLMAAFVTPARSAVVPTIVHDDHLDAANGLLQLSNSFSRVFYLVGGGVIAVVGPAGAFGLNAGSFAVSAGILFFGLSSGLRVSNSSSSDETTRYSRVVSDAKSGLSFIFRTPVVLSVVFLSVLAGFAMAPLGVIFPFFLDGVGLASSFSFALFYGSIFLGIVVGSLVLGNMNETVTAHRGRLMIAGLFASGVSLYLTASVVPRFAFPLVSGPVLMVCFGAGIAAIQVPGGTLMQKSVPDEYRGKVFSVVKTLSLSAPPLSIVVAGPLVEASSASTVIILQAAVLFLASMLLLITPLTGVSGEISPKTAVD